MRKASKPNQVKQAGVTILEFIAFIGLAAVVLAGALGLYRTANQGASINTVIATANGLVASARQAGAGATVNWGALCSANSAASGCVTRIPEITGWATNAAGSFTRNAYTITLADNATTGFGNVTIAFASADEAAAALNLSVGGTTPGTRTNNSVTWDSITK